MRLHDNYSRTLDEKGRCCGRKPLVYKRDRHRYCFKCARSYHLTEPHMVDGSRFLADGRRRLRYPQGGSQQFYHEHTGWWWFFQHGALPIYITHSAGPVYRFPVDPGEPRSWWEMSAVVRVLLPRNEEGEGMVWHLQQARAKWGFRL